MSKLEVGVVGAGILGSRHARVFAEQPDALLVAVADPDPARKAVADRYGARFYPSVEELLAREKGVAAIAIATPDHLHSGPAVAALQAGKHVLLEKPLATTEADVQAIVNAAKVSGCIVAVNYSQRYVTDHQWIEAIVRGEQIGTPEMVISIKFDTIHVPTRMIGSWSAQTSPIFFMSSHDMDLVCHWVQDSPVQAFAHEAAGTLKERGMDIHDGLNALLKFSGGAAATFHTSWIHPNTYPKIADGTFQIIGARGALTYNARTRTGEMFNEQGGQKVEFTGPHTADEVDGKITGAFTESIRRFLGCVRSGEQSETSPARTLPVTMAQLAILESLKSGAQIAIPHR